MFPQPQAGFPKGMQVFRTGDSPSSHTTNGQAGTAAGTRLRRWEEGGEGGFGSSLQDLKEVSSGSCGS